MPFFSTLPAGVQSTVARDRLGKLLYSCVNDDNGVVAGEVDGGELPADWEDGDGEDGIDIEARGGGGLLRKLGRPLGQAGTTGASGTNAIVSRVVAFASTTSNIEVESLLVVPKSLMVLEVMVDRYDGGRDGREGTGGRGAVGGFLGMLRLLLGLEGVKVDPLGGRLSLWSTVRGVVLSASLLDRAEESTKEDG